MLSLQSHSELTDFFRLYNSGYLPCETKLQLISSGFSGALVYRYESFLGPMALRFWPVDGMSPQRWTVLSDFLLQVSRNGFYSLAVPISQMDQQVCSLIGDRLVHIEPWLSGECLSQEPTPPQLVAAVESLAQFHLASANYIPGPDDLQVLGGARSGISPSLQTRLQRLHNLQAPGKTEQLAAEIFQAGNQRLLGMLVRLNACYQQWNGPLLYELQKALQILLPLQPVWRDLWRGNLLFEGEQVTGFIDPAACACDSVLTDLSRLLGSLIGNQADRWLSALSVYENTRPLSVTERKLLSLFDLSNLLLSAWGCCDMTARAFHSHNDRERTTRLLDRLEEYLIRLETYATFRSQIDTF